MFVLLFVHVALMFGAVGLTGGTLALLTMAHRTHRLEQVGPVIAALPIARITPPLFVLGGLAGFATAWTFGYSLVSLWLVIAYVGFAIGALFGAVGTAGRFERLARGQDVETIGRALEIDFVVTLILYALLIGDMVFKPFQ